ncbi:hypothetical protein DF057_32815 [Burkholderia cepacia]|nr:hypothetical protein WK70_35765 [Burkholderia cepacia]RQZ54929.1 hypothetical protein DF057_32815 [Burkholderia cepacia]
MGSLSVRNSLFIRCTTQKRVACLHIASPYDAPEGAVIVYDTTDESTRGQAEVVLPGPLFASDYISPNSRVMRKGEKPTLIGKGRKVTGVWIK